MSRYNSEFPFPVAYPPQAMTNVLAQWLSKHSIKQAHIAGLSCASVTLPSAVNQMPFVREHRDREVRARHILLQWRCRAAV